MNKRMIPLVAGVVALIVVAVVAVVLVLPKRSEVGKANEELEAAKREQQSLNAQLGQLEEAKEQAPEVERELAELETLIPPTADAPGLIELISEAAEISAIDFFTVAPGAPTVDGSGTFSVMTVQISVVGDFFSMEEFLSRLEALPRAMKVMSVSLAPSASEDAAGLSMEITAEVYTTDLSAGPGSLPGPTEELPPELAPEATGG